jgi:hypothetical protein
MSPQGGGVPMHPHPPPMSPQLIPVAQRPTQFVGLHGWYCGRLPVVTVKQLTVDVVDSDTGGLLAVVVLTASAVLVLELGVTAVVGVTIVVGVVLVVVVLQQKFTSPGSSCTSCGRQASRTLTVELNVPSRRGRAQRTALWAVVAVSESRTSSTAVRMGVPFLGVSILSHSEPPVTTGKCTSAAAVAGPRSCAFQVLAPGDLRM